MMMRCVSQRHKFSKILYSFRYRTFSPFVRKLHRWGFERIMDKKTHAVDVFRHPLFIRGNYVLCDKIRCIGRLVKGPLEEALLAQAGLSNKPIGMPTHQELEIRSFCERMHMQDVPRRKTEVQNDFAAQAFLLEQAARQAAARRQQHEAQEALVQEAHLRQAAREAEARQLLQQQMAAEQSSTVNQILLALQNRNREEELIAQELQRLKQEEILRQQLAAETNVNLTNTLQQARLQELLAVQHGMGNIAQQQQQQQPQQLNGDINVAALLRAAMENPGLAAQLRQLM